ncbi:ABC transporter permease [Priestia koreensis]|uniref:ABC transporter permease n=1 Tax=Priestia koreensis TaxID=284581 RepID=UPI00203D62FA|nr:ABC transporter permease [Priestia koreensis]MCM3006239.1 ABC transporter permease [Priestia koreensis]
MNFRQLVIKNVFRNKRTYAAYFLSSAFSVSVFFVYSLFIFHPDVKSGVNGGIAIQGMKAAEYIIYVFSFFFVLYSVSAFLKSRKKEFGIFIMTGMSRRQLNTMVFLENMLIGIASLIAGILVGIVFGKLFLMMGANILEIDYLSFQLPARSLTLTIGSFMILFFIISLFTSLFVRTNKLIDLFQGSQKPKKEPKSSILLSLLAAVLLSGGYYLAATSTVLTIGFRFFPVIIMVIIGTYFLYTQLSIFLLKIVKKNKVFYWNKTNVIVISDLVYRMKDNARMFFLVTVVSATSFCAVGTLVSFTVTGDEYHLNYPYAVSYYSTAQNQEKAKHLNIIEQDLEKQGLAYKKNEIVLKKAVIHMKNGNKNGQTVTVLSEKNFNKLARPLHVKPIQVSNRNAYFVQSSSMMQGNDEKEGNIEIEGQTSTLRSRGYVKKIVLPAYQNDYLQLVVSNDTYDKLASSAPLRTYTGYYVKDWKHTKGIGAAIEKQLDPMSKASFNYVSLGDAYAQTMQLYKMMLFVVLLVGCVFFIAAGSFLYFRLYTDLEYDKRQYATISRVGLTVKELNKIITTQLSLLFFIPIIIAVIHSVFAFMALQSFFSLSIAGRTGIVLGAFALFQIIYFLIIRSRYLFHIKKGIFTA